MVYFQQQDPSAKFINRIAPYFTLLLVLMILAMSASADQFMMSPYVDEQGNVHFQKPLNQSGRSSRDELAILRLEADYQAAIDDAADEDGNLTERLNDWVNLWTKSGTYISDLVSVVAGFGALPPDIVEDGNKVQGRENLGILLAGLENAGVNGKRHLLSGVRVQFVSPRLAIGQSEFAIVEANFVPAVIIATGRYHSVYQRVKRKWLFRQRKQDVDPAWGPAGDPPQFINSMQDLVSDTRSNGVDSVVNDLLNRVEQLEAQINVQ